MSHCCKLRCLFVISCVHFTLNGVTSQLHRCFIAAHRGGLVLPKMSNCFSLLWLLDISGVLLSLFGLLQVTTGLSLSLMVLFSVISVVVQPLHGVTRCHPMYFNASHWGGLRSPQVSDCCTQKWLHVVWGITLSFTLVVLHGLSCHTASYIGSLVSSHVTHFHSLQWCHVDQDVSLLLTGVALWHCRSLNVRNCGSPLWYTV